MPPHAVQPAPHERANPHQSHPPHRSRGRTTRHRPNAQALEMAREAGLDLVEVADKERPPVCKIMDYGKFKYAQSKKAHQKTHQQKLKEIRVRPKTGDHDIETKVAQARKFLEHSDKVQVNVLFRGREMQHIEEGQRVMNQLLEPLMDHCKLESPARMEGKRMAALLAPSQAQPPSLLLPSPNPRKLTKRTRVRRATASPRPQRHRLLPDGNPGRSESCRRRCLRAGSRPPRNPLPISRSPRSLLVDLALIQSRSSFLPTVKPCVPRGSRHGSARVQPPPAAFQRILRKIPPSSGHVSPVPTAHEAGTSPAEAEGGFLPRRFAMFTFRSPMLVLAVAVVLTLVGGRAMADEATIPNCKVVKIEGTKLTFETPKGVKYTADVASDESFSLNGKDAKLSDFKEGTAISITAKKEGGVPTILKLEGSTK
ncbi:MAG: translation initiation factor IF-3 [Gemmataceae bacterium]